MDLSNAVKRPLWWDGVPNRPTRDPLDGDTRADVAIVGGGFTGLWTAYYLKNLDPGLDIAVLEANHIGYGASGRNGGWCHAAWPLGVGTLAKEVGRAEAVRFMRWLYDAVSEVGRVAAAEGIECGFQSGGRISFACSELHLQRARHEVEASRALGFDEDDVRFLTRDEARAMIGADGILGGTYSPHAAVVQPALLVHGLAGIVERAGVRIYEDSRVLHWQPGSVTTVQGTVRADVVLTATEAYTAGQPGKRRTLVPLHSLMIATERLPDRVWDEIGLAERTAFTDFSNLIVYGQRTADGRLAFGGRGAPYRCFSRIGPDFEYGQGIHHDLSERLRSFFPQLAGTRITHRWGGVLGVSRDWSPSVTFDPATRAGWAGGYVGDGVAMSNLAGRTLAELVLERPSELATLPWVNHRWRNWEPEPLRYVGINAGLWLAKSADDEEARTGRTSWRARLGNRLRGKRG